MKLYRGIRTPEGCIVTVNGRELDMRLDLWNHSPTGFEWGYSGSGPAQLALAILADVTGDDDLAVTLHQRFKFSNVAGFPKDGWNISDDQVKVWVDGALQRDLFNPALSIDADPVTRIEPQIPEP